MHERRTALLISVFLFLLSLVPIATHAQITTGLVQGQVTDPSGAVIPGATVSLTNKATNVSLTQTTDAVGRYSFAAVEPGSYSLRVTASGFQTYVVSNVTVEVTKSYSYNVSLKIGTTAQTVTVMEVAGAELQTTNASIGTELGGDMLARMPSSQRNVASLLSLQPAVAPENTSSDNTGGAVAGAMADQTTFLVDGGDATSDTEASNSYASVPGQTFPAPFIQVGQETTQEFRVITSSPTASFGRAQGGEVVINTRSGTNSFHGSAYEYYTGSTLGANRWEFNRIGHRKPHQVNNRYGATFGGPLLKNRLWFYGNYEGRRFRQSAAIGTDVPTATARQGILLFKDAAGNVNSYNLATSTACGSGSTLCDPRGIGIDPVIQKFWANEPPPNVPGTGDGLNSEQYLASYGTPINEDYGLLKLDYKLNRRWTLAGTYRYQKLGYITTDQIDIIPGQQSLVSSTPVEPRYTTFILTGLIGSHFTNQLHGSYQRDYWAWARETPTNPSNVPGLNATLQVSGEGRAGTGAAGKPWADPVNFNTQNARPRTWDGKDWYLADDASWLHGSHTIQYGGSWYYWDILHIRTDNVLGGLSNAPIFWVGSDQSASGSFVDTTAAEHPPICSAGQAGCIQSSDLTRWDSMYSGMLGLIDHSAQVATRTGNFVPNALGTPLSIHSHIGSFYTYVQDTWQMKPTVTLTYGVNYGAQFPPREINGEQGLQLYTATGRPVSNIHNYFLEREQALDAGHPFPNPDGSTTAATPFEFSPLGTTGTNIPGFTRPVNTYWGSVGPRVAIAWQPSGNKFFGSHQTVVRAGYSIVWNRTNAVGLIMTPVLTDGFAQLVGCNGPTSNGACSGNITTSANAFRVGIDGSSLPMPQPTGGFPLVQPAPLTSLFSFNLDPAYTPPWSHDVSFDIQRTFAHSWMIDVGYIGRFSRNLEVGGDLGAADMFAKDPISGQTLAQAFDNVGNQLRNGVKPANVTPQPYFENMAASGGTGAAFCQATYHTSCTAKAAADTSDLINGNLSHFMEFKYDFVAQTPLDPLQFQRNFWNYFGGWSNYDAGFISVHKSFAQGLQMDFNYTYSHAMGTRGAGQQYINYSDPSPYREATGYKSTPFDRRHVFNASWYYELPFGHGKLFSTSSGFLDRVVGGWFTAGIFTAETGLPLCIGADGNYGDPSGFTCAVSSSPLYGSQGRHNNVVGSGGIATNGNASSGGSGINIFADPAAVYNSLSRPLLTQDLRPNQDNLSEFGNWNIDLTVGKNLAATERYKAVFTADFFNAFNRFQPANPSLDLNDPHGFGVVTSQGNDPRAIQLGLRFEF